MKIAAIIATLAMAIPANAVAQSAPERQACIGDVLRLCASAIPSRERVIACMLGKRGELGIECRAVVTRYSAKNGRGNPHAGPPRVEQAVME